MSREFTDHLVNDLLSDLSNIGARSMFGGFGIYQHKKIFGIVINGELYLKARDALVQVFIAAGAQPFTYQKNNKTYSMCYYKVPEKILNNRELLLSWAKQSIAVE
jgi:DNA transformation protein